MKMRFPLLFLFLTSSALAAETPLKNVKVSGWGFFRYENKKDADYDSSVKDKTDFTQTRINVQLKADLAENYGHIFFAPQFSKISGQDDFAATGVNNTRTSTSGSLSDPRLDMHEAYFAIRPTKDERFYVYLGRQELNYGDHLVLGSVPWHRIGRSFDGVRAKYQINDALTLDAFSMKLQENNSAANDLRGQDANLHGVYLAGSLNQYMENADLYFLRKDNQKAGSFRDTNAFGVRLKSKMGKTAFDYRVEATLEQVRLAGESSMRKSEYQYDIELGWNLPFYKTRVAFEYFDSSRDYDQLFPTAHKWLGFADQFSRRNLKGYVGHLSTSPIEKVTFIADYHIFQRHDSKRGAFNFGGASLGDADSKQDVAHELDLVIAYDFTKTLQLSYGYSIVMPGKYIKDQNSSKTTDTNWSYLQLLARF
ncbi:MAG: alginate export family protein [Candidatus Caldatribacteriota bacterium]